MKKIILVALALLMLTLAACAGSSPATDGPDSAQAVTQVAGAADQDLVATAPATIAAQDTSATVELSTSYENAVSVEYQLLLGTLSLTHDLAVTEGQASVLLPLWKDLKTLSMNMGPGQGAPGQTGASATPQPQGTGTETQAQIDELVKQIEAAMTPEQIEAIAAMKITWDSAMTIMQAQGLTMGGGSGNQPPSGGQPPTGGQPPSGAPSPGDAQPPGGAQPPSSGHVGASLAGAA
jgi:hypothetical protein